MSPQLIGQLDLCYYFLMPMDTASLLYEKHVKKSAKEAPVQLVKAFLSHLTVAVTRGIGSECNKVYLGTRVIKHVYDKRPAEEFDFLIERIYRVVRYPDRVYKNKDSKRGSYVFVKKIDNLECLCSIETAQDDSGQPTCEVATFFRPTAKYLKSYELLWGWEGGTPPS